MGERVREEGETAEEGRKRGRKGNRGRKGRRRGGARTDCTANFGLPVPMVATAPYCVAGAGANADGAAPQPVVGAPKAW